LKKAASGARGRITIPGGRNVIDSRRLLYFYHVARMGSFSAAEAILGVAQPALSRQIQQLEEDLGTQLLERNGRGVSLTQYGEILQKQALTILGEMSNALEQLQLARRKPTGQISIAAPAGAMAYYMPEILRRYVAAFPEIQITATQASTGEVYDQLAGGLTDVAIIVEPRSTHKMICHRLMVEPLWLVARRDHAIAKLEYVDRKQLADIKLMLPGSPHGMRENIDRYAAQGGIEYQCNMYIDSVPLQKALVLDADLCTFLPRVTCETDLDPGKFVWRPLKPALTRSLYVASLQVRSASPFVQAMIREVIATFRQRNEKSSGATEGSGHRGSPGRQEGLLA
jgi:LysR family nitrogen assimilation transcriptional regulator